MNMFELVFTRGDQTKSLPIPEGRPLQLGRDPKCDLHIDDPFISAEHAEVKLLQGQLHVRQTKGRNALLVAGQNLKNAILSPGESFSIGESTFSFRSLATDRGTQLVNTLTVLTALPEETPQTPDAASAVSPPSSPATQLALIGKLASVVSCADTESLAVATLRFACERLGATRALLVSVQGTDRLDVFAAHGFPAGTHVSSLVSRTVLGRILHDRHAVLIGDTAKDDSNVGAADSVRANSIRAVACTPILGAGEQIVALLYVDNQERSAEFSTKEGEFLVWLGHLYRILRDNLDLRRRLEAEVLELKTAASASRMIAESPGMLTLLDRARKAAGSSSAVLITGETGTGKECLARFVHQQSAKAKGPFVAVNCAAIPETLFESEMFGHRKGAFTGAVADRKGAFQEASGGTLFLDEIGDLDYGMQTKLLRAVQERTVRPVGGDRDFPVDVRLVCATNRDLQVAMQRKEFREDLYFRIGTVRLELPPLRERKEDILPLAKHFVRQLSDGGRTLAESAERRLLVHSWPGNIRELRGCIEQAVIFAAGSAIEDDELGISGSGQQINLSPDALADVERRHITAILNRVNGNKTEAALLLGIARSTLVVKLKSYRIG
jgi:DNA-binding NtrC family response regulator